MKFISIILFNFPLLILGIDKQPVTLPTTTTIVCDGDDYDCIREYCAKTNYGDDISMIHCFYTEISKQNKSSIIEALNGKHIESTIILFSVLLLKVILFYGIWKLRLCWKQRNIDKKTTLQELEVIHIN